MKKKTRKNTSVSCKAVCYDSSKGKYVVQGKIKVKKVKKVKRK